MLLHLIAYGKIGRGSEAELVARYLKRITWPMRLSELSARDAPPAALPPARTIVFDERGAQLTSAAFAAQLGHWRDAGIGECRLIVGGADGHDAATRASAHLVLGFGAMTWPHLLVRAMLAEQLWRATSILAGHPYHRAE